MRLAPTWALTAEAIDAAGDPHLRPGLHLRVQPTPIVGLPVAPLLVYRFPLGTRAQKGFLRTDITWIDARGATRTLPFDVTDDNPVDGYLPVDAVCCWIEILTADLPRPRPRRFIDTPVSVPIAVAAPVPRFQPSLPVTGAHTFSFGVGGSSGSSGLRAEVIVGTARGEAVAVARERPPYQLASSRITRVRLSGRGRVTGVNWLDPRRLLPTPQNLWAFLSLPIAAAQRYAAFFNGPQFAEERVRRGAPLRFGLHQAPDAAGPAFAPTATDNDEWSHLQPQLHDDILPLIDKIVSDTTGGWRDRDLLLPPIEGVTNGAVRINCLGAVLQGALDPGVSRWLGFMEVDTTPVAPGDVVAYLVRGFFEYQPQWINHDLTPFLAAFPTSELLTRNDLNPIFNVTTPGASDGAFILGGDQIGPIIDLGVVACATAGVPPERPRPPVLDPIESGPWMPRVPPIAEREVALHASGLRPGAAFALARQNGLTWKGLNPLDALGRPVPLAAAIPPGATSAGEGDFFDRTAPPDFVVYRGAQRTVFGHWSEWGTGLAPAKERPLLPPPVPLWTVVAMTPAQLASPVAERRRVRVTVPVPELDALPPACFLPQTLEVTLDGTTVSFPSPAPGGTISEEIDGPFVDRAASVTVHLTARWIDTASRPSERSDEVELVIADGRPPDPVTMPTTILYTSRPDATALARATLTWTAAPPQRRFRIFYSDEAAILRALTQQEATLSGPAAAAVAAVRTALEALPSDDIQARAAGFQLHKSAFDRGMFEQLTREPLARAASGQMQYVHDVSGALRVLSFYRVVSVSDNSVESDFAAAPLVVVAVPNTGAPPQPLLRARALAAPLRAELEVMIPRGAVPPTEYRLRRSSSRADEALRMPVVDNGPLVFLPGGELATALLQSPAATDAPLAPWNRYAWRVEVRGTAAAGGGPTGEWSDASLPAMLITVPEQPPDPATAVTAARESGGVTIRWQHADALRGGALGSYRFDIYRYAEAVPPARVGTVAANAPPEAGGRNPDHSGDFHVADADAPAGTVYRVVITDPIGRTASAAVTLA